MWGILLDWMRSLEPLCTCPSGARGVGEGGRRGFGASRRGTGHLRKWLPGPLQLWGPGAGRKKARKHAGEPWVSHFVTSFSSSVNRFRLTPNAPRLTSTHQRVTEKTRHWTPVARHEHRPDPHLSATPAAAHAHAKQRGRVAPPPPTPPPRGQPPPQEETRDEPRPTHRRPRSSGSATLPPEGDAPSWNAVWKAAAGGWPQECRGHHATSTTSSGTAPAAAEDLEIQRT